MTKFFQMRAKQGSAVRRQLQSCKLGCKGKGGTPCKGYLVVRSPLFFVVLVHLIAVDISLISVSHALFQVMAGDISSYFKGGPPQGEQLSPTCRHEVECDVRSTSSWREIFAVARCGAGSTPPTLGVNFVRAVQNIITIEYTLAAYRGGGSLKGSRSENATLTLGQDLRKLGLGAVVWDCVSGPPSTAVVSTYSVDETLGFNFLSIC